MNFMDSKLLKKNWTRWKKIEESYALKTLQNKNSFELKTNF